MWEIHFIFPELIICFTALAVLTLELFSTEKTKKLLGVMAGLGLIGAIAYLTHLTKENQLLFHNLFIVDTFSQVIKIIILCATLLVVILSIDFIRAPLLQQGEYYCLILCSIMGMMLMVSSLDFISFFLSLQLTSIPLYTLAGIDKNNVRSNEAAYKYLMLGLLASVIMLYGMSLVYGFTASTSYIQIGETLRQVNIQKQPALILAILFIFTGFVFKIAAVPFHFWVPDTYEGAPTPVTAFLATAPKVAGFAALLRFVTTALWPFIGQWRILFIILSIVSMCVGNIVALSQTNIKRMLGFSSIAHIGYILMALSVADFFAYSAAIFYLMIYLVINIGAFAVVTALSSEKDNQIEEIARLCKKSPFLSLSLAVFLISMIGIPPTPGFWGKLDLFASAINKGMTWLAMIGIINSAISVYFYMNVLRHIYVKREEPSDEALTIKASRLEISPLVGLVVGLALIMTIIISIYPQPFMEFAKTAASVLRY